MATSDRDLKALCLASGNRCAFPDCDVALYDVENDILIGEKAHIRSGRPDGPRFDPSFPDTSVDGIANQMFLCPNHHATVDKAADRFPITAMEEMKASHERTKFHPQGNELSRLYESASKRYGHSDNVIFNVASYNQRGGQTAGIIANVGPRARTFAGNDPSGVLAALKKIHPRKASVIASGNAPDAQPLAEEIRELMRKVGWTDVGTGWEMSTRIVTGIEFRVPDDGGQDILDLANAFRALGWRISAFKNSPLERGVELEIRIGLP